ncbi:MAG TPA: NAD(P)-dependent alcohol dehydrogenase [Pseudonocardia sp.]|uniref:NAD(P)-dependent alcohol dehydrogenase n=1 Tax=Pseudonocardia sp. TaxID=60912 RepID=UPI002CAA503B|nr:NAD(P)-dependent alcohol dehydrogenase [Pseudonocardia sp.]HTF54244.1 NAD(P)-dependent alcohol dehydrogenase [Pseudonocardia sp.]
MSTHSDPNVTPRQITAYATLTRNGSIEEWSFRQREARPHDVVYDVLLCGICHTDVHMIGPWGQHFPVVPGHEIIGRVTEVGEAVTGFAVGDIVAVGTMVDSCRRCGPCTAGMESYCENGATYTYDGLDRIDGSVTRGGFARSGICDERFLFHVPDGVDLAGTAPLLCAGITSYSPLRRWNVGPGSRVGVVGVGGLGHVAIKLARTLGAEVTAFTTSPDKVEGALALGAHDVVVSRDEAQVAARVNTYDFILDTVSTTYPMTPIVNTLKLDGTLCSVGIPDRFDVLPIALAQGRRSIASSGSGGTRETAEMLAFCAQHGITADVEVIKPDAINDAFTRLAANDVRYRFVIDMR